MCGLIGYIGNKKNYEFVVNILKKLEYRGYDSSGLAAVINNRIKIYKETGPILNLEKKLPKNQSSCMIAHTRWATHGKTTKQNAHPHISADKTWTVVHNGIIENYKELKAKFKLKTISETDTEIIAQLLAKNKTKNAFEFIETFKNFQGSFAVVAINKNQANQIFAAKNKSPLYVAKHLNNFLFASDPACFANFSDSYYCFNDNEFAHIKNKKIIFYNKNNKKIIKKPQKILKFEKIEEKNNFPHFMLKEIFEEPLKLKQQINCFKKNKTFDVFNKNFLKKYNKILLLGCGTAYHACQIGAHYFEQILNIPAQAEIASEFIYKTPNFLNKKTLVILISQSGETADTILAQKIATSHKATTIGITNVAYSTLSKLVDFVIPIFAGPEIAVASTKAYVCQLSALYALVCHFKNLISAKKIDFLRDILEVSENILNMDFPKLDSIAQNLVKQKNIIFIGKNLDYITACEAALKIKEITYINATAHPAGELKHGYLAMITKNTPVFAIATIKKLKSKTINASEEAIARGANAIYVSNINRPNCITINCQNKYLTPILAVAPMQYIAYKISILKELNPDKPRNLAKSVTVE